MSTALVADVLNSSRFKRSGDQVDGIPITYWESTDGAGKPPLLLLHGSGPGAATHGNWRLVLAGLADHFHVIATDLIGFGQSGRKTVAPYFDYPLWLDQAAHVLGKFGSRAVNVLGHSLSGSISLSLAARDQRVRRVMTTGTLGAAFSANAALDLVWSFPKDEKALVEAGKTLVYDPALITQAYIDGRKKVLYEGDYEHYFKEMFSGDKQRFIDLAVLSDAAAKSIECPVLLVHGRDDRPTPHEVSRAMAAKIKRSYLVEISRCGHSIALEHPGKVVELAHSFFLHW